LKRSIYLALGFVYLSALFFSLLIFIKPGASFFYKKLQIQARDLIPVGNTFEYQVKVDRQIYDPGTLMILEGQAGTDPASPEYAKPLEKSAFTLKETGEETITILFAPNALADPTVTRQPYSIYIRPYFVFDRVFKPRPGGCSKTKIAPGIKDGL
jgi:hypothetical protein